MKKKQQGGVTQLSLFSEEQKPVPPPRLSQTFERKEMSLAEMTERRDAYLAWGKAHDYPDFRFADPRKAWEGREIIQDEGEQAWRQSLLTQPMSWVIAAIEWVRAQERPHHHMDLRYRDGRKIIICSEDPNYAEKTKGDNCYAGFVGGALTREKCSLCNPPQTPADDHQTPEEQLQNEG